VKLARFFGEKLIIRAVSEHRIKKKLFTTMVGDHTLFEREVTLLKHIDHPNVCPILKVMHNPDREKIYFISEYMEGGSVPIGIGESDARGYFR